MCDTYSKKDLARRVGRKLFTDTVNSITRNIYTSKYHLDILNDLDAR